MILSQYDLSLIRVCPEHLEEIRQWRNTDKIKSRMEFREHITAEMQREWFEKVNDVHHYLYFVIHHKQKNIGLIHIKDYVEDNAETGMFIWDDNYLNTHLPVLASSIMGYLSLDFFGNSRAFCRMLRTNKHAIDYNMKMGMKLCENQEQIENQLYQVTREDYEINAAPIREMLKRIYKGMDDAITIKLETEDYSNDVAIFMSCYFEKYNPEESPVRFRLC